MLCRSPAPLVLSSLELLASCEGSLRHVPHTALCLEPAGVLLHEAGFNLGIKLNLIFSFIKFTCLSLLYFTQPIPIRADSDGKRELARGGFSSGASSLMDVFALIVSVQSLPLPMQLAQGLTLLLSISVTDSENPHSRQETESHYGLVGVPLL